MRCPGMILFVMIMYVFTHLMHQENYRMGGAFKWPPMSEVFEYRKSVVLCTPLSDDPRIVRARIVDVINTFPFQLPITDKDPMVC